jgi:hypothetical protein
LKKKMHASSACKVQSTVPGELRGSGNQSQWAAAAGCVKLPPVGAHWEWRDKAVKLLIGRKPMRTRAVPAIFAAWSGSAHLGALLRSPLWPDLDGISPLCTVRDLPGPYPLALPKGGTITDQ